MMRKRTMEMAEICTDDVTTNRERVISWAEPAAENAITEYWNRGSRDAGVVMRRVESATTGSQPRVRSEGAGDRSAVTRWPPAT